MKKLLVLANDFLISDGSAGATVMCGLVEAALQSGLHVRYVALVQAGQARTGTAFLPTAGVDRFEQRIVPYRTRAPRGRLDRFRAAFDHALTCEFDQLDPAFSGHFDLAIGFDSRALSILPHLSAEDKIGILGDPVGDRFLQSKSSRSDWSRYAIGSLYRVAERLYFRRKLGQIRPAMFGTGHARDWARWLGKNVIDLRPFLPDFSPYRAPVLQPPPRIAFGGTLQGTASKLAHGFLKDTLVPMIRQRLGDKARLLIVGHVSPEFEDLGASATVDMLGRVSDFQGVLAGCHAFVLPMRYSVGVRTRVCGALQAGCPVIADRSVLFNMPELASCAAVRIVDHDDDWGPALDEFTSRDQGSIALSAVARRFFEEHYSLVAALPLFSPLAKAKEPS